MALWQMFRRFFSANKSPEFQIPPLLAVIALLLIPLPAICALSQGTIKISPAQPVPGELVTVTWTLVNTTGGPITGPILYELASASPTSNELARSPATTLQKGQSIGKTFTFLPVPGLNQISVVFLNTKAAPPSTKPPTIPRLIDPSLPSKPQPTAGSTTPSVPTTDVFPATVSLSFNEAAVQDFRHPFILTPALRKQLLSEFSPLLLYSYDHSSDEQYQPIDAIPFVQGSSLYSKIANVSNIPNSTLESATASVVASDTLNPGSSKGTGTITTSASTSNLYLEPNDATQHGSGWTSSKVGVNAQGMNIGLYGRAVGLDLPNLSTTDPTLPTASLLARYNCSSLQKCAAHVVKLEYWQLYGYSADYNGNSITESEANHQGDWCGVQVYVDFDWFQSSHPERAILWVVHYLHGHQIGFNMAMANPASTLVTVPARSAGDTRPTYSAQQFRGPHYGQSVELSVKTQGSWFPLGGPDMTQQLFQAQNNVLSLAAEVTSKDNTSFRHPVVYVEWGGHEFWPTDAWSIYAASKHNGTGQYSYFGDSPVDITANPNTSSTPTIPSQPDVALVTLFSGFWGAPQSYNGPPQGPPLHCEYYWDPATNTTLLNALHAGEAVDQALVDAGQIGGTCGGDRPY